MQDDEIDELFGPEIKYEQPAKPDNKLEKYYRLRAMFEWQKNHGRCACGTLMEFEDYYQHGECLECLQKEMASNIENPF